MTPPVSPDTPQAPNATGATAAAAVLEFENIRQDFRSPTGAGKLRVLDGISFQVPQGSFVAVIGPSGCGKSTLLNMAAGLLPPTEGIVRHGGSVVSRPQPRCRPGAAAGAALSVEDAAPERRAAAHSAQRAA